MYKNKILNISTFDSGGAGGYASEMNQLLNVAGYHSNLIVRYTSSNNSNIIALDVITKKYSRKWLIKKIRRWFNKRITGIKRKKILTNFDYYFFQDEKNEYFTAKQILSKLPESPDVIILYWISEFITSKTINELYLLTGARIFWMMMDNSPITGGCHYPWICNGYQIDCSTCPAIIDKRYSNFAFNNLELKQKFLPGNLTFVAYSEQDYHRANSSLLCKTRNLVKLLGYVDEKKFKPGDKYKAKQYFNIPIKNKVIFFGAAKMNEKRKGMELMIKSLINLKKFIKENHITVLSAGSKIPPIDEIDIQQAGYLSEEKLIMAYQAAHVFVCPSIEDSGPLMINQAMICGTPVVAMTTGVAPDLVITGKTGYIAKNGDISDLTYGIKQILSLNDKELSNMSEFCIKYGISMYGRKITSKNLSDIIDINHYN